jgi:hypothetical protein
MNDPDSISDPVVRRISYTGSYPSTCGSTPARLFLARLAVDDEAGESHYDDVSLTGHWHGMLTVHADVTFTSGWCYHWHAYYAWWRHIYIKLMSSLACLMCMMTSSLSRSAMWDGSTSVWVGSTHSGEEDACDVWPATSLERDGAWARFQRSISTPFSQVALSLPPLHSGMVKTQFWKLLFLTKNQTPL